MCTCCMHIWKRAWRTRLQMCAECAHLQASQLFNAIPAADVCRPGIRQPFAAGHGEPASFLKVGVGGWGCFVPSRPSPTHPLPSFPHTFCLWLKPSPPCQVTMLLDHPVRLARVLLLGVSWSWPWAWVWGWAWAGVEVGVLAWGCGTVVASREHRRVVEISVC